VRRKRIPHPSYPFENTKHFGSQPSTPGSESADDRATHDSIMFKTAEVRPESSSAAPLVA
jgi:hypothetical protein